MDSTKLNDPFFLVYDSRSGSTFLANLLVKYVGAAIPPETNFITAVLSKYLKKTVDNTLDLNQILNIIYEDKKFGDWNIERKELKNHIQPHLPLTIRNLILQVCDLYKNKNFPDSHIFGLKKGVYLMKHQQMKEMFPQAKFVGIIRDGRAVFNSKKHSIYSVTGKPFEINPYRAAKEWCKICQLLKEVSHKYPAETINIQYEKMIQYPDDTIASLRTFFDLSHIKDVKEKSYIIAERYGDIHKNVEKKPLKERVTAWKNSLTADEIFAFESIAYEQLLLLGYSTINNNFVHRNKLLHKGWMFSKSLLSNFKK